MSDLPKARPGLCKAALHTLHTQPGARTQLHVCAAGNYRTTEGLGRKQEAQRTAVTSCKPKAKPPPHLNHIMTPKSCNPQVPPEHREPRGHRHGLSQQPPAGNQAQTQAQSAGEIQRTRSLKFFLKISLNWLMSITGPLSMNNFVLSFLTSERLRPPSLKAVLCMKQDLSSPSTPCAPRASPGSPAELGCVLLTCSS